MQEAKAHPGVTAAATKAKPGSSVEEALKSFFSEAHQKDKNKPYDSPMTKEEWEGMTASKRTPWQGSHRPPRDWARVE